jgi:hypothetical protein
MVLPDFGSRRPGDGFYNLICLLLGWCASLDTLLTSRRVNTLSRPAENSGNRAAICFSLDPHHVIICVTPEAQSTSTLCFDTSAKIEIPRACATLAASRICYPPGHVFSKAQRPKDSYLLYGQIKENPRQMLQAWAGPLDTKPSEVKVVDAPIDERITGRHEHIGMPFFVLVSHPRVNIKNSYICYEPFV